MGAAAQARRRCRGESLHHRPRGSSPAGVRQEPELPARDQGGRMVSVGHRDLAQGRRRLCVHRGSRARARAQAVVEGREARGDVGQAGTGAGRVRLGPRHRRRLEGRGLCGRHLRSAHSEVRDQIVPVAAGDSVGSFKILTPLGRGGMGEVFRASDSRLGRDVALKFLRVDWASDLEARARFEREARAIAALTHPNIGALYDVGEHDGSPYLVMECVEGETLADRLSRGPLSLGEATRIGSAIAEAMAFAHRSGIVHRDLKPANVMLTKTGVKLLDFGLAKVQRADGVDVSTAMQTEPHAILGTLPYMAPEQLTGGVVDARTDIFAFGAVLFEMVAGRRLFDGASSAAITSAILRDDPPRIEPPAFDRVMRRCLAKDPDQRWQSVLDIGAQLAWVPESTVEHAPPPRRWIAIAAGVAVLVAVATLAWPGGLLRRSADPARRSAQPIEPAYASIALGRGQQFVVSSRPNFAISADGKVVAFSARQDGAQHLFVRRFNQPIALRLDGTTGAQTPSFSPDGKWIVFGAFGKLRKVAVTG